MGGRNHRSHVDLGYSGHVAKSLSRSKGGQGPQLHAAIDSLGNSARLMASPEHRSEVPFGAAQIERIACCSNLADRAYDTQSR
ncbi:hypothetical protein L861_14075 [Litchfieldella anticariensis FP35 = DSM 16096]|uniref:Transposase IS4-like domain-containing protein n=1 Tax=Litchfieldella anticariensis (strain DSM 16096 / CECT 5854 / CIP 108499 / LMG 22089 / FP35) TaxID=1121939 RepID=S2KE05_LITA3|nr:hypothetical protein [Halomonas anticariensis]EPC00397.1 hypothetical protein L861_14075 [Halomonas anticariensis FP35 = DSM 16096]